MSDTVIRVENLGKRYLLKHQQQGRSRYVALRDVIADGVKAIGQRILHPNQHKPSQTREEFWALKDVSFEVKQGEVVGIIGRNGAGKSTLLKLLSRITEPTTGRISIKGRVGSLLEVGTGFHPELTGRENIYLNGAILGMSKAEIRRKFDEIVDFAEIEKFLDTPVKHYSSGMYVRLAFAVAAHLEPEILVVDEVLAVGDAAFQKKCLGKMGDVAKDEGSTILFVSHNMTALQTLCKQAIWINEGQIISKGESHNVVTQYLKDLGNNLNLKRVWNEFNAPGNDKIRWKSVEIQPIGSADNEITVETELKAVFQCWNYQSDVILNFSLHLFSIDGIRVFNSFSYPKQFCRGLIQGECQIPSNLLNDETYQITIMIVESASWVIHQLENIITFQVSDIAREVNWYGKWQGLIRPKLKWKVLEF